MWYQQFKRWLTRIATRVTIWYTGFMVLALVTLLGATFWISARFVDADRKESLVEVVEQAAHHETSGRDGEGPPRGMDREAFDQGIMLAYYDNQNTSRDPRPDFFNWDLPQQIGAVRSYQEGDQAFLYYDQVLDNGQGWVRGVITLSQSSRELSNLLRVLSLAGPLLVLIMVVGGYWVLKRALAPIRLLDQTARQIQTSADLSQRIPLTGPHDELYDLSATMNQMLTTVETAFEREKQFSHDVSHDLRTPVTVILSESEYGVKYAEDLAEAQESHATIQRQALRMKALIEQILELSRVEGQGQQALVPLDLSAYLAQRQSDDQTLAQSAGKSLSVELPQEALLLADEILLGRLWDNLLSNALKYAQRQVVASVIVETDAISLQVADDGPGISDTEQEAIWQRFYQVDRARTKSADSGAGLGLSLVKAIADVHGAQVQVSRSQWDGACFIVRFPRLTKPT